MAFNQPELPPQFASLCRRAEVHLRDDVISGLNGVIRGLDLLREIAETKGAGEQVRYFQGFANEVRALLRAYGLG